MESRELEQRKLYFYLEHLRNYHSSLPEELQVRIPYEILSGLANCLLNNLIFEIVKGLMEIQHVTESHLKTIREEKISQQKTEIQKIASRLDDPEELEQALTETKMRHTQELKQNDTEFVLLLDDKVRDQQITLSQAGVPGFYETTNPKEVKIQMHLIDFILRLSRLKFDPNRERSSNFF